MRALIDRHAEDIEGFIRSVRSILRTEDATAVALENARARTEAANNYYKEAAIPELLTTLGIARYRVGDARAAIEAFDGVTAKGQSIEPETFGYLAGPSASWTAQTGPRRARPPSQTPASSRTG